ncbi:SDR family oxidoreductase [Glaciimonas soli]|uniref:SDR family oxidoreductase n=1 Tax=Glaciimonas soli TaxID=2590999 RepID=A0A843YJS1_9BURK|nr:SDR family oxidoreductase [Glaciimonas soli]MQQ99634.1 SDR family oxidoreductase [Glaciimonas soli]
MMNSNMQGKTVVITGGSSGIGLATVECFIAAGANVAFCGRDETRLRSAEKQLREKFPDAALFAASCDVLKADQINAFAEQVQQHFGGVAMLVNNAGQGRVSTFANTTDDAWREELELKYFSIINPTRAFLPLLEQASQASIVCVNSLLALQPEPHMVATSSARAGVLSLVHSMAVEFAPKKIRVNSILVGLVESGQWRRRYASEAAPGQSWEDWTAELAHKKHIHLGRLGKPEEAASAIFFLASPMSSYTTGSHIDVSGGLARHV